MRFDVLHGQLLEILESMLACHALEGRDDEPVNLSETDMFRLWNLLGEELGIDLSLASPEQLRTLLDACQNGKSLSPKQFGSLLWLMYYADPHFL